MIDCPNLADFLLGRKTNFATGLPLVHSAESSNLIRIINEKRVKVTKCDTFENENLAYFFLGRPAYRKHYANPMDWQLPFVLIFERTCLLNIKRVFPFDTGAFSRKYYPEYITNINREGYECGAVKNAQDLIIETFFGGDDNYLHGRAYSQDELKHRSKLGVEHHEILALAALYSKEGGLKADDRSAAIEFQSDLDVPIADNLLGCIMPRPYFQNKSLKAALKPLNIQVKSYDVWPLSTESYIGTIYGLTKEIYKKLGIVK